MKVDYINPILIASSKIIKALLQEDITLGRLSLLDSHNLKDSVAIILWMTGDFDGRFIFAIKRNVALQIASAMMGERITELNDMAKSAVAEMATIILGRTGIIFSERGIDVKISYPTLVEGDSVYISTLNPRKRSIINIPLIMSRGNVIDIKIESGDLIRE
ncbi:CheC domain protein [Thermoclostridium stercorarium subsp. stercorarium DSM 8532]|jgi:chemotaxis protein CheX|uniref:CheC domain protein n=3 Tax=Thermoclostridium stercorarium TaxID=1510 RepID=L7VLB9_THES1|nr:chemotaxis protein CheX [Thermoclostridium stercorarium]AGC68975.1 CheC domain protein [Thermoclostridium stercorarium subsp. stercorarium DSM 8532]AGI39954.1 MCP methylation inhibitor [Thermoclostridium stercorarium subsp. stercorarium DSM 8532]ANW99275.1 chemotaxis protein CheC [Thermoclostridium stercorarium subsp. thermolacticum DSM 2910]ANX01904.1 chemotaxis protein CheC [Thermoclostridium stercorarium subsp. leptospartum DSM 9219]UZQ84947.1 chemotaxis protein CheX [Thermoclostridium s